MANHGVYATQQATSVSTPVVAESGVPFVVGTAPVQSAASPAKSGIPVLCTSWQEAVEKLGYSDDWETYTLCESMYAHFKLYGCQPVIYCNVLDITANTEDVAAASFAVSAHKVQLPFEAIRNEKLVVKQSSSADDALVEGTDYSCYYDSDSFVVELLEGSADYSASTLSIAYSKISTAGITESVIAEALDSVDLCATTLGTIPDLICAPGCSQSSVVAAVMATKAGSINGLFHAKALIDLDSGTVTTYDAAIEAKNDLNLVDPDEIICWPMVKLGDHKFHLSTQLAGVMAQTDSDNDGCPYESPSNKTIQCDAMVLKDGTEVNLTHAQANTLGFNGIVTALNFMGGWVAWGNYTACYPSDTDVKDYFISVARMFGWVGNSLVKTFWSKLDKPMNRRLLDNIVDSANIWLNGLVGSGYLLGARAEIIDSENTAANLMAGIVKIHVYMTPPSPAQEINFVLEYDVDYITAAFSA